MSRTLAPIIVDVRGCKSPEGIAVAIEAFDVLAIGETLMLVASDAAPDLLRALQTRRKGLFEWSLLEAGPGRFRIEIARRDAQGEALREVTEALAWDHDRLDALEELAFARLAVGDEPGARELWAEFAVGLRRHIRFEEAVLFPEFEARCGTGPTGVMRFEHRRIEALIEAIGTALADPSGARRLRTDLHDLLGA